MQFQEAKFSWAESNYFMGVYLLFCKDCFAISFANLDC